MTPEFVDDLILRTARHRPEADAVVAGDLPVAYSVLAEEVRRAAAGLAELGLRPGERVAILLEKRFEPVVAAFAIAHAGGIAVPLNPLLKPPQVEHALRDSGARILLTTGQRLLLLEDYARRCPDLESIVVVEPEPTDLGEPQAKPLTSWDSLLDAPLREPPAGRRPGDSAAILYTSGSTGRAKGVALTHANLVAGAESVVAYLEQTERDRVLAVLPLSFDAGFSQLTTTFLAGGTVVLHNHLVPKDVLRAVGHHGITGLTAVPPLWIPLSRLEWPAEATRTLRFIANTGGAMPSATLAALRARLPSTRIYLMYGFTEAFRSTYLAPEELDRKPTSVGKAIPNAEVFVVRPDGTPCEPGEPGELVHAGPLVARGYWNDPEATARRFRPLPTPRGTVRAAWSGDTVRTDEEGFVYFIGRDDDMIKTSGYRVSPTEIEEAVHATGRVAEAAAFGVPHPVLGQAIALAVVPLPGEVADERELLAACKRELPTFMLPSHVVALDSLPRNANGKIDRNGLVGLVEAHTDVAAHSPPPLSES